MTSKPIYLIDSDVFITAKNLYYAFDICPGFWDSLVHHCNVGNVRSVDRVKNELLGGKKTEDLVQWVKNDLSADFFLSVDGDDVTSAYTDIMVWIQRDTQYFDHAKAKFAAGADGWLVAYAMAHNTIIVTGEQPAPESKSQIKIPDICNQFKVTYTDVFSMLRDLAVRFEWKGAA